MAGISKAERAEVEALRAELQSMRGDLDFRSQAHLPPHGGHVSALDSALARVHRLLGEDDMAEHEAAPTTQVETVPPGSAGGAAADPATGATTNVPFSAPLAEGDTSSIPGAPDYDPAAQAEVERDAARRQHAAERTDAGGGSGADAHAARTGEMVELREPFAPGLTDEQLGALRAAGYGDVASIRAASDEQLLAVDGIGPATVKKLREAAGKP